MRITGTEVFWLRLDLPEVVADAMTDVIHWDVIATRVETDEGITGCRGRGTGGTLLRA